MLGLGAGMCACVLLTACGGSDDKKPTTRMVDRARASGDRIQAKAEAAVKKPEAVAIRVSAAPKQRVTVVWALSCTNGNGDKEKTTGGSYSVMTPNIHQLQVPDKPRAVCQVEATTKLLTGRVKTTLLATTP
ncbi:MAG: hypothetical protein M3401_04165 [Actinomycetota bacterium]|nr:hypothetical protein [Actinomycetota bacterium]